MFQKVTLLSLAAASLVLAGCYRPGGAFMSYTGAAQTYASTEMQPKTVQVVDVRSNEVIFSMDVPPGKQLTLDFVEGSGDDPVYTPDLMRYMVFDMGTQIGSLQNSMTVPAARNRRVDWYLREGPEYMTASPEQALRTDQEMDRPEWWTPQGGEMPEDPKSMRAYHD